MTAPSTLLLFLLTVPAFATYNPPPACNNPFTPQQEITEGAKVAAQVYKQMPILPENDPVSRYVAQLGAHLVSHAPGLKWPYTFHVVASPDVNAFALPGGSIFVNLGTIQAADTEAQLAGVLAHETSHVVLRHSTCNIQKQQTNNIFAGLGSIASRILLGDGVLGQVGQTIIGGGSSLYGLRMSRDDEKQADLLGVNILADSGYDPRGMSQFFEIIQAKYGAGGSQLLTDHPNPGNRTQYVNAEIATLPRQSNPVVTSASFSRAHTAALQQRTFSAQQIKDGAWKNGFYISAPGQNVATNPSQPSPVDYGSNGPAPLTRAQLGIGSRLVPVRTQTFRISQPANWQSTESQGGATLAPPGGAGAFGIAYGAIIGTAQADGVHDEDSLASATQQLAQQISQQNGGLRQISPVQVLSLSGQTATAIELRGRSPLVENGATLPEREWLVAIPTTDGDLRYIVFVAPERDFAQLRPTFVSMMNTFRPQ